AELVTNAIQMAIDRGLVNPRAVFHSDRGSQYTSTDMHDFLHNNNMRGSMGRVGDCWDNSVAESFFASLKKELVHRTFYPNHTIARHEITSHDFSSRQLIGWVWSRCVAGGGLGLVDGVEEGGGPGPVLVEVEVSPGGGDSSGDVEKALADGLGGHVPAADAEGPPRLPRR
ncbi:MAG: DDE-type integrase/transposase/recombinase, partial [Acidimicrobiales bacterium]